MEEIDPTVESAVLNLLQTITRNLNGDGRMTAWLQQVGLADDAARLMAEIDRVNVVMEGVKGWMAQSGPLSRSLSRLRETLYNTDDIVDELDYFRLQQQAEAAEGDTIAQDIEVEAGPDDEPRDDNSVKINRRSKAWNEFTVMEQDARGKPLRAQCVHCQTSLKCDSANGTSALLSHLKSGNCKKKRAENEQQPQPSSVDASGSRNTTTGSRKRGVYEGLEQNAASATLQFISVEYSGKMLARTRRLKQDRDEVNELLNLLQSQSSEIPHYQPDTSSIVQNKIFGRSHELEIVRNMMRVDDSKPFTTIPLVGIAGIGKTRLAQYAYSNAEHHQFHHRIWITVSADFDEVRLLRQMLDSFNAEHHHIQSFARLQDMLNSCLKSKRRILLIFDDIWDTLTVAKWNRVLAPLIHSNNPHGTVIFVTTRSLSVAKKVGTVQPIKVGSLEANDFWMFFKACAFGDENHEGHPSLQIIGMEIAEQLTGNPLAAETAGMLLIQNLRVDHWNNILKNEKWKSLKISEGIIQALKRSYDFLPTPLKRCFSFLSLFPKHFSTTSVNLIRNWVAQGFVDHKDRSTPENTGKDYLDLLVNYGIIDYNESGAFSMHKLMHDLAFEVSKTEFDVVNGLDCREIFPTVRHLSIMPPNYYDKNASHHDDFDKKMKKITSVKGLRSLIIGWHANDRQILRELQNIFKEAESLRVLEIFGNYDDIISFLCNLGGCAHLRYLNLQVHVPFENRWQHQVPSVQLQNYYHLEVLKNPSGCKVDGVSNLVNLKCLIVNMRELHSGSNDGEMRDQHSTRFDVTEIKKMKKLVQLHLSDLEEEDADRAEGYGPILRDKEFLESLYFSWKSAKKGLHSNAAQKVLEALEPYTTVEKLSILQYSGDSLPNWVATSAALQVLRLENFEELQKLPSLTRLTKLTELVMVNMQKIRYVSIPITLEKLTMSDIPKLERCSCNSLRTFNSALRVVEIRNCGLLRSFPLFEYYNKHIKVQKDSWTAHLATLIIDDCPNLMVSCPLPLSEVTDVLYIQGIANQYRLLMESGEKLMVRLQEIRLLDDHILAFDRLSVLSELVIDGCGKPTNIMFSGLRQLIKLRMLHISHCQQLLASDVVQEGQGDMEALPPYLKYLRIQNCGIKGSLLFEIMRHLQALEELDLEECHLTGISLEESQSSLMNLSSAPEASSSANSDDADGHLRIPCNVISSLKKLHIDSCGDPVFFGSKDGFTRFTALELLGIWEGPKLFSSLVHKYENRNGRWLLPNSLVNLVLERTSTTEMDEIYPSDTLQICFPGNQTSLVGLEILGWGKYLKSLQLQSCTALENLSIRDCELLSNLDGLQFLGALRHLNVCESFNVLPYLEHSTLQGYKLCSQLESLEIDTYTVLNKELCSSLTSLQFLYFVDAQETRFTEEQESALQHLASLQELHFSQCSTLGELPVVLCFLPSLMKLKISHCPLILKLPETGLPALEELELTHCSMDLTEQCRMLALATSQPRVKIDCEYVN